MLQIYNSSTIQGRMLKGFEYRYFHPNLYKKSVKSCTCSITSCKFFHYQDTKFLDCKLDGNDQPSHQQYRSDEPPYNRYNASLSHSKSVSQPPNGAYQLRITNPQAQTNSRCYKSWFYTALTSDAIHARQIAAITLLLSPYTNTQQVSNQRPLPSHQPPTPHPPTVGWAPRLR